MSSRASANEDVWTVLKMILWSADYLGEKGVPSPRLDAEHLLAHTVGVPRLQLYLEFDRPLSPVELDGYRPLLRRRAGREPLQYIIGRQPFRELDLEVRPGVLIPRPETEALVDLVFEWAGERDGGDVTALDVGTGTGAIAISLAVEGRFGSVVGTDVSQSALELARRNCETAGVADSVSFREGPLFAPLGPGERFDVIASNPPYIAEVDESTLEPEVREWEPHEALFAGEEGLDVLQGIVGGAHDYLKAGGLLALEVGTGQALRVSDWLTQTRAYANVRICRDYARRERFVVAHAA